MSINYNGRIINLNELSYKKKFFDDLLENDFIRLNKNFDDYLSYLKYIKLKKPSEIPKKNQLKKNIVTHLILVQKELNFYHIKKVI